MASFGRRAVVAAGLAAALGGAVSPALAQAPGSQRPYRALFGGRSDATARHRLNTTVSLAATYDSDVPEVAQGAVGGLEAVGHSTLFQAGGDYAWLGRRVQVNAAGTSAQRYYAELDEIRAVSSTGVVGVSATLPARLAIRGTQSAARTPLYVYNLFPRLRTAAPIGTALPPVEPPPSSPEYAVAGAQSYSYGSSMMFGYDDAREHTLMAIGEFVRTESPGAAPALRKLSMYSMRGQYVRRVDRNMTVSGSYRYGTTDYAAGGGVIGRRTAAEHSVEVGVNYRKPLSARRQFTFDSHVGSAALVLPDAVRNFSVRPQPYRLLGDVAVGYQFLRTWQAHGTFRSSVDYVAGLAEPVATKGITAGVDGWLNRRLDLFGSAGYSNGEGTWTPSATLFDTYTGDLRLRYALSRVLSVYGEYLYYFYDFSGTVQFGSPLPPRLKRNGGRAGLTLNLPILRR